MARRYDRSLKLLMMSVLPLTAASLGVPAAGSPRPTDIPHVLAEERQAPVVVTWTFRGRDIFSCENSAYDLREVIRLSNSRVHVQAVGVDADSSLIASFLRTERLPIQYSVITEREYRRRFGREPTPAVQIALNGEVVETMTAGNLHIAGRRSTAALAGAVTGLLNHPQYSRRSAGEPPFTR